MSQRSLSRIPWASCCIWFLGGSLPGHILTFWYPSWRSLSIRRFWGKKNLLSPSPVGRPDSQASLDEELVGGVTSCSFPLVFSLITVNQGCLDFFGVGVELWGQSIFLLPICSSRFFSCDFVILRSNWTALLCFFSSWCLLYRYRLTPRHIRCEWAHCFIMTRSVAIWTKRLFVWN